MTNKVTNYSVADLIQTLENKNLTRNTDLIKQFINSNQVQHSMPTYIQILLGIGALIASCLFFAFLFAAGIIDWNSNRALVVWGVGFIISAMLLYISSGKTGTAKYSFILQSSFMLMIIGKALFTYGLHQIVNLDWGATLAMLIATTVTYFIYRLNIERFLSVVAILLLVFIHILFDVKTFHLKLFLFDSLFLLQVIIAWVLFSYGKVKYDYLPIAYAIIISLVTIVMMHIINLDASYYFEQEKNVIFINNLLMKATLSITLIALSLWVAKSVDKINLELTGLIALLTLLLGIITTPGILLAFILMILGYAKHERLLLMLGTSLLMGTLFLYYYYLDMSLLIKSVTLIASGMLLLLARLYIKIRGWAPENQPCND